MKARIVKRAAADFSHDRLEISRICRWWAATIMQRHGAGAICSFRDDGVRLPFEDQSIMASYLDELLDQTAAAHYLQSRMPNHNALYFLADNRRGKTGSVPRIPYTQKRRSVYYRRGDIVAFAEARTEVPASAVGKFRVERAYTDDAPTVAVRHGAVPVIEIGWFPDPVTLTREAAQELVDDLVSSIKAIDAAAAVSTVSAPHAAPTEPSSIIH